MLKFNNGKFRIMQITDIQDTQFTSADTLNFIDAAIKSGKPDLVVLTGDQVKGYGVTLKIGDKKENIRKTIENIIAPLKNNNTPFIYCFGNHDAENNCGRAEQNAIYESFENCVCKECSYRLNSTDTMILPIYDSEGNKELLNLYIIDNCKSRDDNDYTEPEVLNNWLFEAADKSVHAIVFQHKPVYEMYDILKEVPKNTKDAIEGNVSKRNHYYVITDEMALRKEYMHENIACCDMYCKQFATWKKMGNIMGAFFGHDHINSFTGKLDGIELGYTPGAGFNIYGPSYDRAVRIFDFDNDSAEYRTKLVTYRDLLGENVKNKFLFRFYNRAPSSVDAAKPIIKKSITAISAVTALTLVLRRGSIKNEA